MRMRKRLSHIRNGRCVSVAFTPHSSAQRWLVFLGLIEGVHLTVECQCPMGDVIVRVEDRRYRIPARIAQAIWVTPAIAK